MSQSLSDQGFATRVVVDALGGDRVPQEPVAGAVLAARRFPDSLIILAGPEEALRAELDKAGGCPVNLRIVHAPEAIGMHESPVQALRVKKNSSITLGLKELAEGKADAFVSAGNTGAVVAASSMQLGLIEGVQRPGIAVPMKAMDHTAVMIDAGANIYCKPTHLLQYGVMAAVFAKDVLELEEPRVGLLNVGEEAYKGPDLLKEAFGLLSRAGLNFVGNVEPHDIYFGGCDIVVCDGFVGNVLLKASEALTMKFHDHLKKEMTRNLIRKIGFALCKGAIRSIKDCGDYAEYGGAPLLGVNGVTIICHGRSDARAIENAVREARSFIRRKVNQQILERIRSCAVPRNSVPSKTPIPNPKAVDLKE